MRRTTRSLIATAFFSCIIALSQGATASGIDLALARPTDTLNYLELGQAISPEDLGELTALQDININQLEMILSTSEQSANANGNSINNYGAITNGANTLGGNAFSQATGIVTVIQNSGNQVLIQNDMIMNLTVR